MGRLDLTGVETSAVVPYQGGIAESIGVVSLGPYVGLMSPNSGDSSSGIFYNDSLPGRAVLTWVRMPTRVSMVTA